MSEKNKEINFAKIEQKWQKKWEEKKIFQVSDKSKKPKFYVLEMFPYPSGSGLHMGHALNYTIGDIFARFKRMNGFNVLYPMGYDALGLPAENAAIKDKTHPEDYTKKSMKNFMRQQKMLGLSYDWSRLINTSSPDYYKWDQWIFLKMLEKGLAYQKEASVNWCPSCKTVLANEQAQTGNCERCGSKVEIKTLKQWFLKITDYADELLDKIDDLDWPARTKAMQKNWIGKSYGTEIDFEVETPLSFASYLLIEKSFDLDLEKELPKFGIFEIEEIDEDWGKFFRVKVDLKKEKEFIDFVAKNILVENPDGGSWYVDSCGTTNKVVFRNKIIDMNTEKGKKEFFDYGRKMGLPEEQLDVNVEKPKFPIFTTRPDTIYGVTFMVISAQHPKLFDLVTKEQKKEVENFLKKLKGVSEKQMEDLSKEGVFTGSYAINPVTKEKIPIWAGNFVVADYGSGMVMAVPAHDQRDFLFAKKYEIPIKVVIDPIGLEIESPDKMTHAYTEKGNLINSGEFNGIENSEAKEKITLFLEKLGVGRKKVQFKLRDWLISRQRYWGTPIPIVYCEKCGAEGKKILSLNFREEETWDRIISGMKTAESRALNPEEKERYFGDYSVGDILEFNNKNSGEKRYFEIAGKKIFNNLEEFFEDKFLLEKCCSEKSRKNFESLKKGYFFTKDYFDKIEKNGLVVWEIKPIVAKSIPVPEKDLPIKLPKDVKFGEGNPLKTNEKWIKTKCPKCGGKARRETDTMDTFVNSSWYFARYCDNENSKEIFDKKKANYWCPVDQYIGGAEHACMHLIYSRFYTKFLRDIGLFDFDEPFKKLFHQGMLHGSDGEKMSKSRGNTIDPINTTKKYGSDSLRLALMSFASPDSDTNWDEKVLAGSYRFLIKVKEFFDKVKISKKSDSKIESKLNKIIKEVTNQIENFKYNLAIIKIRELFSVLFNEQEVSKEILEKSLKLLSPFCPHITEELFEKIGGKGFVSLNDWPKVEENKIDDKFEKQEQAVEKIIEDILNIGKILEDKKEDKSKVFVYVMPNEFDFYDEKEISKKVGKYVKIFAVNDKEKYDPNNISKKSKPNKPGIYFE